MSKKRTTDIMNNIQSFYLENKNLRVRLTNYGAIIQEIWILDKKGIARNIVLGHKNPIDYFNDDTYLGACIGRYAGRLSGGLSINKVYHPLTSENGVHLHGGKEGFNKKIWIIKQITKASATFTIFSPDGDEGYPGNLWVEASYKIIKNRLFVVYSASTDSTTCVNLTNHTYFNLHPYNNINSQFLKINADHFLELNNDLLPTGSVCSVKNSNVNFKKTREISSIKLDHVFVLNKKKPQIFYYDRHTGIELKVTTNQPGVVIYIPDDSKSICFETQNFPDAPKYSHFPNALLNPEENYSNQTFYEFSVRKYS